MQSLSVDSPVQNKTPKTVISSNNPSRPLSAASMGAQKRDSYALGSAGPSRDTPAVPAPLAPGARSATGPAGAAGQRSAADCIDEAERQFAAGRVRQGVDWVMRGIDSDRSAVAACLQVLWSQAVLARLPNVLRHVLNRFSPHEPEFQTYQWLLTLSFHAAGNRQMGLRQLGQAITACDDGKHPPIGGTQVPTCDHWLRGHGMAAVAQIDFWKGAGSETSVGDGISRARCSLIDALALDDENLEATLPLVGAIMGAERQCLVSLGARQTLRLLELHARQEAGLTLSEDEVRAMVVTLTEQQRLAHLCKAVALGAGFHVETLLDTGVKLGDVPRKYLGQRTCQSPYLMDQLLDSGVPSDTLANLIFAAPSDAAEKNAPLPTASLRALLVRRLDPDHRIGGGSQAPSMLWEALRRRDLKTVTLLREFNADCNAIMQVIHNDGGEGLTTPGIYALAQGDALLLRAMHMDQAEDLLPGVRMMLAAVKKI